SILLTRACGIGLVSSLQNTMPSARKSSAYFARPVTFASRSGGTKSLPISGSYAICDTPPRVGTRARPGGPPADDTEDGHLRALGGCRKPGGGLVPEHRVAA